MLPCSIAASEAVGPWPACSAAPMKPAFLLPATLVALVAALPVEADLQSGVRESNEVAGLSPEQVRAIDAIRNLTRCVGLKSFDIGSIEKLGRLDLGQMDISSWGLENLNRLDQLRDMYLPDSVKMSKEQLAEVKRALPRLKIIRD